MKHMINSENIIVSQDQISRHLDVTNNVRVFQFKLNINEQQFNFDYGVFDAVSQSE